MQNKEKNAILVSTVKNVKMQDAGEKRSSTRDVPCCSSLSDDKISYPSMYLNTKQVPTIKGMEVEDEITLVIRGKITGHSLREDFKDSHENYDISIKEIGILDKEEIE